MLSRHRASFSWLAAATLLLTPSSSALEESTEHFPWFAAPLTNTFDWPTSHAPGAFGRTIAGRFRESGVLSSVVLVDGTPYLIWSPEGHGTVFQVAAMTATDITSLPRAASSTDLMIAATATGLIQIEYVEPTGFMMQSVGDDAWDNARRITARDVDRDGDIDLVGLSADGSKGLVLYREATGYAAATVEITLQEVGTDILPMDYAPGGPD